MAIKIQKICYSPFILHKIQNLKSLLPPVETRCLASQIARREVSQTRAFCPPCRDAMPRVSDRETRGFTDASLLPPVETRCLAS
ncbi:MAG TPA: hypothetical protein ENF37_04860, partial [Beggiatoa sp.]|nr:hypothetical protein [Beggiatoa sp.]